MNDSSALEHMKEGILAIIANVPPKRSRRLSFAQDRSFTEKQIKTTLAQGNFPRATLDFRIKRVPKDSIANPYTTQDAALIDKALSELVEEGYLTSGERAYGRTNDVSVIYSLTQKGAERHGDPYIIEAFSNRVPTAQVYQAMQEGALPARGQASEENEARFSVADVKTALGAVLGTDSPLVQNILDRLGALKPLQR